MEIIAGVDEVGRGPLAGPVVAAAVILPEEHGIDGLRDSKKLSPQKREVLNKIIMEVALSVGIGCVSHREIDKINILNATYKAMQIALGKLGIQPTKALIDGKELPNQIIPNEGVIGGDNKIECIMAASIVAKVFRDNLMVTYDKIFPAYQFASNKGYGTKAHLEALRLDKASPIHRKTFNPVGNHYPTLSWLRSKRLVGKLGEQLAALYLLDMGYEIWSVNENCPPYGEIDIVCRKNKSWNFVEVKTISKKQMGTPEMKVDESKLGRLNSAIELFMMQGDYNDDIQLDVITVELGGKRPHIQHFQGIDI